MFHKGGHFGHAVSRMDSCIGGKNQGDLANALRDDNLTLFADTLHSVEDINGEIEDEEGKGDNILHLAISTPNRERFVEELIRMEKLDVNVAHKTKKMFPIHLAAEEARTRILKLLLQTGADVNAKMENGSTPLHLLAVRSKAKFVEDPIQREGKKNDFLECVQFVAGYPGVQIDCKNNIGVTPLQFAVEKGSEAVAEALLKAGACVTVETDDGTIESMLEEKMPDLFKRLDLSRNRQDNDAIENQLFHLLYNADEDGFISAWKEAEGNNNSVNLNADNGTYTYLQYSCDQGLERTAAFLLEKGVDPNYCSPHFKTPPLVIAGHHGYYKIVKLLRDYRINHGVMVNFAAVDENKNENVLHKVLKAESKTYVNYEKRSYETCLNLLLDTGNLNSRKMIESALDHQDQLGRTPLHNAAEIGNEEAVAKLLRAGVNIGIKDNDGRCAIDKIPLHLMEEFLDDCLLSNGLPVDRNFTLTFNYAFLGPPLKKILKEDQLLKEEGHENDEYRSKESENVKALPEAEPLWYISQSPTHKELLAHPVIKSFLCLKWRRIRPYYYINLGIYLAFVALLTAYLLILTQTLKAKTNDESQESLPKHVSVLKYVTGAFLILLTFREGFQALCSFRRYIFNFENLLELTMLGVCYALIFGSITEEDTLRYLAGSALLLSWVEMVLLFGRHPKLGTYITMFSTVSFNFFLFLMWYASFIIAFGLAFFIVLPSDAEKEENAYFATPDKSLLKTVVMSLAGELEFESIKFGGLFTVVLFLLYIFFIMLVLVNLLNGLAVSDIALIQKQAEIVSLVSRVEIISYMESMLLGDPFHFFANWPPVKSLQRLPSCGCFRKFYSLSIVRRLLECLIGDTLLFQSRLAEKRAVFLPNKSRYENSLPGPETDNLVLDSNILESATDIMIRKRKSEGQLEAEKLKELETGMKLIAKQQNHIIELLGKM